MNVLKLRVDTDSGRKMPIKHPVTGDVVKDCEGLETWVEVRSFDSAQVRDGDLDKAVIGLVTDWYLGKSGQNEPHYPYTPENAKSILSDPGFKFLREQMMTFALSRANFMLPLSSN